MNVSKKDKPEPMEVSIPINLTAVISVKAMTPQEAYKKAWDELVSALDEGFKGTHCNGFDGCNRSYRDLNEDDYAYAEVDGAKVDGEGNLVDDFEGD